MKFYDFTFAGLTNVFESCSCLTGKEMKLIVSFSGKSGGRGEREHHVPIVEYFAATRITQLIYESNSPTPKKGAG